MACPGCWQGCQDGWAASQVRARGRQGTVAWVILAWSLHHTWAVSHLSMGIQLKEAQVTYPKGLERGLGGASGLSLNSTRKKDPERGESANAPPPQLDLPSHHKAFQISAVCCALLCWVVGSSQIFRVSQGSGGVHRTTSRVISHGCCRYEGWGSCHQGRRAPTAWGSSKPLAPNLGDPCPTSAHVPPSLCGDLSVSQSDHSMNAWRKHNKWLQNSWQATCTVGCLYQHSGGRASMPSFLPFLSLTCCWVALQNLLPTAGLHFGRCPGRQPCSWERSLWLQLHSSLTVAGCCLCVCLIITLDPFCDCDRAPISWPSSSKNIQGRKRMYRCV